MAWYILGLFSRISDGHSYPFYPDSTPPPPETIDRFYKANATLPTKTPTDFIS